MAEKSYGYEVFGLRVLSEVALPDLHPCDAGAAGDIVIRYGAIPPVADERQGLTVSGSDAIFALADIGRYWMRGGVEMIVEPDPACTERNLRLFLLGSAFAALLHQRSLLPLHANAIVVGGKAIAFLGHPGAGKSTMAAWFHDRGFAVLADDVCVVTFDAEGRPLAHPGIPRLRLWREALEASGRVAEDYEMSFDDMDKYNVPTTARDFPGPVPLDHLYLLDKAEEGEESGVTRLKGAAAVEALSANTYRGAYVRQMGRTREHMLACARLAGKAPLFRATRLWGLSRLDEQGAILEAHARALIDGERV